MSNKKKTVAAGIAILLLILIAWFWQKDPSVTQGEKQITIVIDAQDLHIETAITTQSGTLKELLLEQEEWHATIEDGPYGAFLTSLAEHEQDRNAGPWWIYTSENNRICQEQGMCPALDQVSIEDGDVFHFSFTSQIE